MYKHIKKGLALFLAALLLFTYMPVNAQAAVEPAFQKTYSVFYENRANKGIYDITVKNVQKGYILKWRITGLGKTYASFENTKTIASAASVTNKLTINSKADMAFAAAQRIRITVNVYTAKWKLVKKLTFAGKLQSKAKAIDILTTGIDSLNQLAPGRSYQFQAAMTPANATSKVYWQVKDASGTDHSAEITADGLWTPLKEGTYTITALAKNSPTGQPLCTKSIQATVGNYIASVDQTASNGIHVTFHSNASEQYKETDFSIRSGESSVLIKKLKYMDDGKTAYITTATNFIDGKKYTVSCAGHTKEFTAHVGKPVALSITTGTAQCEKYTTIEYVLLDANNIDVTNTATGSMQYSGNINNGILDPQTKRLYMTTVGSIGNITLEYTAADGTHLTDTKAVICVPQKADEAVDTHFTVTNSVLAPSFKNADERTVSIGETMYAHFQALDENDASITYDSVTYASSDPDKLIISSDGRITPIKTGSVTVVVTARQESFQVTYPYVITIQEGRRLASIQMKETSVTMSNTYLSDYQKEIAVSAIDQYGRNYPLINETGTITEISGQRILASYDAQNNNVIIRAQGAAKGTYNFILTLTMDGYSVSQNFSVIVSAPVSNGVITYRIETSNDTMDLSVDQNTTENRAIKVRLCEYRGGVFYGYKYFTEAVVRKDNVYYGYDMVNCSTQAAIRLAGSNVLTLTPLTIIQPAGNESIGTCQKAKPGVYTVSLTYLDSAYRPRTENIQITLTDGQTPPDYTIRCLTSPITVTNALELVNQCIEIPNGAILDCTATGTRLTGSSIPVQSGEQLHIERITIRSVITLATGNKVYVPHEITIDKTLTNK